MLSVHAEEQIPESLRRRHTRLHPAAALGRELGMEGLYLKLEGATPSGNHKYGMAQVAVHAAARGRREGVAVASCGNFGRSVALLCHAHGVVCRVFAPAGSPAELPRSPWITLDGSHESYEAAVAACDEWSRGTGFLNATAGRDLGDAYLSAYAPVAEEIIAALGHPPAALVCPAGNGTTLASLYRGFEHAPGPLPAHFAATVPENGFGESCFPPAAPDWITEPLRSSLPLDRAAALRAVDESGGAIVTVGRDELERAREALRRTESIDCHPASAAPLAVLPALLRSGRVPPGKTVVAILTTGSLQEG
jgi:threonine synthase